MHVILLAVGVFLAIIGIVLIRYGVPLDEYGNSPLLVSGTVALVGGVISCGLFFVVAKLARIAERLEIQPLPLPPIADISRDAPPPRATAAPPLARAEPAAPPVADIADAEQRVEPRVEPAPAPQRVEVTAPAPRVDPIAAPPREKSPMFGWLGGKPKTPVARKTEPAPSDDPAAVDLGPLTQVPQQGQPVQQRGAAPPGSNGAAQPVPAGAAVYKSGVIDGMAYTLYTDGSIEAQLPQGPIRFASVEALQSYLVGR